MQGQLLGTGFRANYVTVELMVGVPQDADKLVVLGGMRLSKVVGAVAAPIEVAGLDTPVPPEMLAEVPAPDEPSSFHTVVKVSTVPPALSATCVRMNSGV